MTTHASSLVAFGEANADGEGEATVPDAGTYGGSAEDAGGGLDHGRTDAKSRPSFSTRRSASARARARDCARSTRRCSASFASSAVALAAATASGLNNPVAENNPASGFRAAWPDAAAVEASATATDLPVSSVCSGESRPPRGDAWGTPADADADAALPLVRAVVAIDDAETLTPNVDPAGDDDDDVDDANAAEAPNGHTTSFPTCKCPHVFFAAWEWNAKSLVASRPARCMMAATPPGCFGR